MRVYSNINYAGNEKLDIYAPEKENFDTIVYFHGGGLECGKKDDCNYIAMAEDFTNNGYGFVSVNYRLYPDAKYPDYLEDAASSVKYIKNNIASYSGNGRIYIAGQSAGAWMTLMLCLNHSFLDNVGIKNKDISGWIIDSAQTTAHFNIISKEFGMDSRLQVINEFAPLFYVNKDIDFNRMLIIFYSKDMPCRPEQNRLFIRAIKQFNSSLDLTYKMLPGTHCYGSSVKDEDGRFPFVKLTINWLKGDKKV